MSFEYACVFLVLLLVVEIDSQIGFTEDDIPVRRPSIRLNSPDCNCIEIRRCRVLYNRQDWRTAGETCMYANGKYRKVCCPPPSPSPTKSTQPPSPPFSSPSQPPTHTVRPRTPIQGCGQIVEGLKPLIMGGQNATEGMWPWMAAIRERERTGIYSPSCTGFLIDRRHVMSAAHCFERDPRNDRYVVRIGSINQDLADEYRITRIVMHSGYRPGQFYNDIAIMILEREVNSPNFNPVCLPDEEVSRKPLVGEGTTVAGWGADRPGGRMKTYLQYLTQLPIVSNTVCHRRLHRQLGETFRRQFPRGVSKDLICAGFEEGFKDACGGDSGGPLMLLNKNRWYAIGIVSFGYECGIPGMPGGYTKISSHLDWIQQHTRN